MSTYGNGDVARTDLPSLSAENSIRWIAVLRAPSHTLSRMGCFLWPEALVPFAVLCGQLALFGFLAFHRIVDSDEGFYLYASKLLAAEGTLIYRDFFYPQMPLLPFVYGGWMRLFGFGWYAGRALSVLLTALIGTGLFLRIRASTDQSILALSALLLYVFNISVLLFFLTAKTYALSSIFLFAAMIAAGAGVSGRRHWSAFAAGLLVGLSTQVRLFFVVAAPVIALWLWRRHEENPHRLPWLFGGGFIVGSIPSLLFLIAVPEQFIFDTFIYHSIRNPFGLVAQSNQKLGVVWQLLLGTTGRRPTQFTMLFASVPLGLLLWKRLNDITKISILLSVTLAIVSVLPTPTFVQYFCVLVPFLIISLVGSLDAAFRSLRNQSYTRAAGIALLAFSLMYAGWAATRFGGLFIGAEMAPGLDPGTEPFDWKIATIERVAAVVKENTRPDALTVSKWPGYLLTADRRIYPGMENQFSLDSSMRIPEEKANRYRMMRDDRFPDALADPATGAVVIGNWSHKETISYAEALDANNYRLVGLVGNAEVFVRDSAAPTNDSE